MVQMPALNTPQFDWVRSRLPRQPQPVPPIFQPEVAADAIVHAAAHPRRQYWVGAPTVKAIVGEKLAPSLLDHYLARTGYDSQQTDQPVPEGREDNLWSPVPRDFGAHGRFDTRARRSSALWWADSHRGALSALFVTAVAAVVTAGALASQRRRRARWF
jgi:hypothetical protein